MVKYIFSTALSVYDQYRKCCLASSFSFRSIRYWTCLLHASVADEMCLAETCKERISGANSAFFRPFIEARSFPLGNLNFVG